MQYEANQVLQDTDQLEHQVSPNLTFWQSWRQQLLIFWSTRVDYSWTAPPYLKDYKLHWTLSFPLPAKPTGVFTHSNVTLDLEAESNILHKTVLLFADLCIIRHEAHRQSDQSMREKGPTTNLVLELKKILVRLETTVKATIRPCNLGRGNTGAQSIAIIMMQMKYIAWLVQPKLSVPRSIGVIVQLIHCYTNSNNFCNPTENSKVPNKNCCASLSGTTLSCKGINKMTTFSPSNQIQTMKKPRCFPC